MAMNRAFMAGYDDPHGTEAPGFSHSESLLLDDWRQGQERRTEPGRPVSLSKPTEHQRGFTMSQHSFATTFENRPVKVVMGWDRPLQGYFCFVERQDAGAGEAEYLYSNLDDRALARRMGFSPSTDYFTEKLMALGIAVPRTMIAEVRLDCAMNIGNRYVRHQADDTSTSQ